MLLLITRLHRVAFYICSCILYTFVVSVKRLRKNVDIHEDGFYCKEQKKKEREMRAEKEKMEKEKLENKRMEEERIEKETQTTTLLMPIRI